MEQIHLGDQIIWYDGKRTRTAYAAMKSGSAESCGCPSCRNFVRQRSTVYPEKFRLLLDQLGIHPEKEGEVYEGGPEGSLVRYGGWFYLSGELIEEGKRMTDAGPNFQYFFRASHRPTVQGDFGEQVLALEFSTKLPWVISQQPEWLLKAEGKSSAQ
jgi:hypothetical protein